MREPRYGRTDKSPVLPSHRVPAHLARRFHQICLGVTGEILLSEDLTPMLWGVLVAVLEEPGNGQRHVASRMGVDPVTFGQMIDVLEQKDLVRRQANPNDRRAHQLYGTRRAIDLRRRLTPALLTAQDRLLGPLKKTERGALIDLLSRVIEANNSYARPGNGRRKPRRKSHFEVSEGGPAMMACRQRLMTRMPWSDLPDAGRCSKRTGRIVMRTLALFMAAACTAILACPVAARAEWPERPVKLVVTFPPGSANDAAARIFADGLARKWGKPVVVEAKTGAEGTIGVASFVSSQDDHTLLYTVSGSVTVAPLLIDKLPYDVDLDLKPIAATTAIVLTLAVSNSLSIGSIPELISVLRSNPGKYAWTSGPTLPRYVFASFLKQHGLKMNFVSYRDASQPQADLGEGRIQALMTSLTASSSPVQTGKARFLAVINPIRAAALPELPTVRELGYPELEIDGMAGIFGGQAMSEALRNRIAADIAAVGQEPDVRRKLEAGGHIMLSGTTEELRAGIGKQRQWVHELAKLIDIRNAQ